jgi:hypothetical protein
MDEVVLDDLAVGLLDLVVFAVVPILAVAFISDQVGLRLQGVQVEALFVAQVQVIQEAQVSFILAQATLVVLALVILEVVLCLKNRLVFSLTYSIVFLDQA